MPSLATNRSKRFCRDFIPENLRALLRSKKNSANTLPKISELLCNKLAMTDNFVGQALRLPTFVILNEVKDLS